MKVLLALNSFKGSCTSLSANRALKSGLAYNKRTEDISVFPLCDGGDGSVEALGYHLGLKPLKVKTIDALGKKIDAVYLWDPKKSMVYIELASASGLARLENHKNRILQANTLGTGRIIKEALKKKPDDIVLMIGGSATNDAGIGILHALGIEFLDHKNRILYPSPNNLIRIRSISTSKLQIPHTTRLQIWTDVTNFFTGPEGAVAIYSKQKNATPAQQKLLETGMLHFSNIIKQQFGIDLQKIKGTGAAGGVGGGLTGIIGAEIHHGTHRIFELIKFDEAVKNHDILVTGEGALDDQTKYGKLVDGVLRTAKRHHKPVIGVCGNLDLTGVQLKKMGFLAAFSVVPGAIGLVEAKLNGLKFLKDFGISLSALLDFDYSSSSNRV